MATESISLLALPAVRDFLALERVGHLATADATRPGDRPDAQYCGQPQRRAGR